MAYTQEQAVGQLRSWAKQQYNYDLNDAQIGRISQGIGYSGGTVDENQLNRAKQWAQQNAQQLTGGQPAQPQAPKPAAQQTSNSYGQPQPQQQQAPQPQQQQQPRQPAQSSIYNNGQAQVYASQPSQPSPQPSQQSAQPTPRSQMFSSPNAADRQRFVQERQRFEQERAQWQSSYGQPSQPMSAEDRQAIDSYKALQTSLEKIRADDAQQSMGRPFSMEETKRSVALSDEHSEQLKAAQAKMTPAQRQMLMDEYRNSPQNYFAQQAQAMPQAAMPQARQAQAAPASAQSVGAFQSWAQSSFGRQATPQELQQIAQQVGITDPNNITPQQFQNAQRYAQNWAQSQQPQPQQSQQSQQPQAPQAQQQQPQPFAPQPQPSPQPQQPQQPQQQAPTGPMSGPQARDMFNQWSQSTLGMVADDAQITELLRRAGISNPNTITPEQYARLQQEATTWRGQQQQLDASKQAPATPPPPSPAPPPPTPQPSPGTGGSGAFSLPTPGAGGWTQEQTADAFTSRFGRAPTQQDIQRFMTASGWDGKGNISADQWNKGISVLQGFLQGEGNMGSLPMPTNIPKMPEELQSFATSVQQGRNLLDPYQQTQGQQALADRTQQTLMAQMQQQRFQAPATQYDPANAFAGMSRIAGQLERGFTGQVGTMGNFQAPGQGPGIDAAGQQNFINQLAQAQAPGTNQQGFASYMDMINRLGSQQGPTQNPAGAQAMDRLSQMSLGNFTLPQAQDRVDVNRQNAFINQIANQQGPQGDQDAAARARQAQQTVQGLGPQTFTGPQSQAPSLQPQRDLAQRLGQQPGLTQTTGLADQQQRIINQLEQTQGPAPTASLAEQQQRQIATMEGIRGGQFQAQGGDLLNQTAARAGNVLGGGPLAGTFQAQGSPLPDFAQQQATINQLSQGRGPQTDASLAAQQRQLLTQLQNTQGPSVDQGLAAQQRQAINAMQGMQAGTFQERGGAGLASASNALNQMVQGGPVSGAFTAPNTAALQAQQQQGLNRVAGVQAGNFQAQGGALTAQAGAQASQLMGAGPLAGQFNAPNQALTQQLSQQAQQVAMGTPVTGAFQAPGTVAEAERNRLMTQVAGQPDVFGTREKAQMAEQQKEQLLRQQRQAEERLSQMTAQRGLSSRGGAELAGQLGLQQELASGVLAGQRDIALRAAEANQQSRLAALGATTAAQQANLGLATSAYQTALQGQQANQQGVVLQRHQPTDAAQHGRIGRQTQQLPRDCAGALIAGKALHRNAVVDGDRARRRQQTRADQMRARRFADRGDARGAQQAQPIEPAQPALAQARAHVVAGVDQGAAQAQRGQPCDP
jgi:hypothetical protein